MACGWSSCVFDNTMSAYKENKVMEIEEKLKDITECSICTETFKEPKILSCIHTFCLKCLEDFGAKQEKNLGQDLPCPICRKGFTIPKDGFGQLKGNFFMERLIEMKNILDPLSTPSVCEVCRDDNNLASEEVELPPPSVYCADCHQTLCEDCHRHHLKNRASKTHRILNLEQQREDLGETIGNMMPMLCNVHVSKPMEIYCSTCDDTVCAICFVENHKSHDGAAVESVVDQFQLQIKSCVESLDPCFKNLQQRKQQLEDGRCSVTENLVDLERDLMKTRDELTYVIGQNYETLIEELRSHRNETLKQIEIDKDNVELLLLCLNNYKAYCVQLTECVSSNSICKSFKDLITRADDLHEQCVSQIKESWQPRLLHLAKGEIHENLIGQLREDYGAVRDNLESLDVSECNEVNEEQKHVRAEIQDGSLTEMSSSSEGNSEEGLAEKVEDLEKQVALLRKIIDGKDPSNIPTVTGNIDYKVECSSCFRNKMLTSLTPGGAFGRINGMTILENELFVVSSVIMQDLHAVEVYDIVSHEFKRRWKLSTVKSVEDMTISTKVKCLYIKATAINYKHEIIRVDRNGVEISRWSTDNLTGQLSSTPESNILLTVQSRNELREYSPEGQLLRVVPLKWNYGFANPWHALKLDSNHYVVSHGRHPDTLCRVCIIDADGNFLSHFGSGQGNVVSSQKLGWPSYLVVDSHQNILVVDKHLGRIIVLSSNLKLINSSLYNSNKYCSPRNVPDVKAFPKKFVFDEISRKMFLLENNYSRENNSTDYDKYDSCTLSVLTLSELHT